MTEIEDLQKRIKELEEAKQPIVNEEAVRKLRKELQNARRNVIDCGEKRGELLQALEEANVAWEDARCQEVLVEQKIDALQDVLNIVIDLGEDDDDDF